MCMGERRRLGLRRRRSRYNFGEGFASRVLARDAALEPAEHADGTALGARVGRERAGIARARACQLLDDFDGRRVG